MTHIKVQPLAIRKKDGEWFVGSKKAKDLITLARKQGLIGPKRKDEDETSETKTN